METLNNYIAERIRVDNVKSPEFPIDETIDEKIKFLKMMGFEEIMTLPKNTDNYGTIFNNAHTKGFCSDGEYIIAFADTSKHKISTSNPYYYIFQDEYQSLYEEAYVDTGTYMDKSKFKTIMKNYFK